jgi:isocitrate/isopropylmalate dehydrogenase
VVQSAFRLEMHQNDVFFILKKNIFEISTSKYSETYKKINKKKFEI